MEILTCVGHQNHTALFPEYVALVWSKLMGWKDSFVSTGGLGSYKSPNGHGSVIGDIESVNQFLIQFCLVVAANEQDGSIKSWWDASTEGDPKVTVWIFIFVCDTCWAFGHVSRLPTWWLRASIP